ncbi:MAG: CBS domain-containing protein [Pirellulaceae bacterium]
MCQNYVAVRPETPIGRAVEQLVEENASVLLVLDADLQLVGTVADSVLLRSAIDSQLRNDPISLHVTRRFAAIPTRAPLDIVLDQFVLHDLPSIPVVDQKRVVGVICREDLLRAAFGLANARVDAIGA